MLHHQHIERHTSFFTPKKIPALTPPTTAAIDPSTGAYVIDDDAYAPTTGYIVTHGEQPPYVVEVQRRSGSARATFKLYDHLLRTTPGATPVHPRPALPAAPQPSSLPLSTPSLAPVPATAPVACVLDESTVDSILSMARSPLADVAHEGWLALARIVASSEDNARFVYMYAGMDGKLLADIDVLLDGRLGESGRLLGARLLQHVYSGRTVAVPLCTKHSKSKKSIVGGLVSRRVARTLA